MNDPTDPPERPDLTSQQPLTGWHTDHVYTLLRRCEAELRARGAPLRRQRAPRDTHQLVLTHRELCTVLTALITYHDRGGQTDPRLAPGELTPGEIRELYSRLTDIYED
jgi:hypothetical protein